MILQVQSIDGWAGTVKPTPQGRYVGRVGVRFAGMYLSRCTMDRTEDGWRLQFYRRLDNGKESPCYLAETKGQEPFGWYTQLAERGEYNRNISRMMLEVKAIDEPNDDPVLLDSPDAEGVRQRAADRIDHRTPICEPCDERLDMAPGVVECRVGAECCGGVISPGMVSLGFGRCRKGKWLDLQNYFDRVCIVNLARRPERLSRLLANMKDAKWPFREPMVCRAVDGSVVPVPQMFGQGGGAWGCRQSHLRILEDAMLDGLTSVLVIEDDAVFTPDFAEKVSEFLAIVPDDWEGIYLGGQHMEDPEPVRRGVVKAGRIGRTHCYAARGEFLRSLYAAWAQTDVHIDWTQETVVPQHEVYCPDPFLVSQEAGHSDISGRANARMVWDRRRQATHVAVLHSDRLTLDALRPLGWHSGYWRDEDGYDVGVVEAVGLEGSAREKRMAEVVKTLAWEAGAMADGVPVIWHPKATFDEVQRATKLKVFEVTASTPEEAEAHRRNAMQAQ